MRNKVCCLNLLLVFVMFNVLAGCSAVPQVSGMYRNNILNTLFYPILKIGETEYVCYEKDEGDYELVKKKGNKEEVLLNSNSALKAINFDKKNNNLVLADEDKIYTFDFQKKQVEIIAQAEHIRDFIYEDEFICFRAGTTLYTKNLSTNEKKLLSEVCMWYDMYENYVFYQDVDDNVGFVIKKANLSDLSEVEIIYSGELRFLKAENEGVYFVEDSKLCRVNNEGDYEIIAEDVYSYNMAGDWIYYSNVFDECKLYRIKKDGTENRKVLDESIFSILIFDDEVYCYPEDELDCYPQKGKSQKLYKINP